MSSVLERTMYRPVCCSMRVDDFFGVLLGLRIEVPAKADLGLQHMKDRPQPARPTLSSRTPPMLGTTRNPEYHKPRRALMSSIKTIQACRTSRK